MKTQDYSQLPLDIAECFKKNEMPITDDQLMLLGGYLTGYQGHVEQQLSNCAKNAIQEAAEKFPTMLRKMWSASEVVSWLNDFSERNPK